VREKLNHQGGQHGGLILMDLPPDYEH